MIEEVYIARCTTGTDKAMESLGHILSNILVIVPHKSLVAVTISSSTLKKEVEKLKNDQLFFSWRSELVLNVKLERRQSMNWRSTYFKLVLDEDSMWQAAMSDLDTLCVLLEARELNRSALKYVSSVDVFQKLLELDLLLPVQIESLISDCIKNGGTEVPLGMILCTEVYRELKRYDFRTNAIITSIRSRRHDLLPSLIEGHERKLFKHTDLWQLAHRSILSACDSDHLETIEYILPLVGDEPDVLFIMLQRAMSNKAPRVLKLLLSDSRVDLRNVQHTCSAVLYPCYSSDVLSTLLDTGVKFNRVQWKNILQRGLRTSNTKLTQLALGHEAFS